MKISTQKPIAKNKKLWLVAIAALVAAGLIALLAVNMVAVRNDRLRFEAVGKKNQP